MNIRYISMFLIAALLAGGAAFIANRWVKSRMTPVAATTNTVPVVVATVEIQFGQKIESAHVKTVAWPKDTIPEGAISTTEEVVGKIVKRRFLSDEMISRHRIAEHLGGSTLSALISPEMRAISVRVNDVVGVSGFIMPGNRVDVLATRRETTGKVKIRTILESMRVLAVDQEASPDKEKPAVVRAVTLEMSPDDAETLVKSMQEGTLQLTLRNPLDDSKRDVVQAKPAIKKRALKVARKEVPVTVIRGTHVNYVSGNI